MEDREMLEDLLVVALKDAHRQAEAATEQRMSGFSQGLPPGFKLPF
jgi:DNA-binding protein YbaB